MDRAMPNLAFRGMSLVFNVRDLFSPRRGVLEEVDIQPGDIVLDYGCGPGAYVPDLAERVGATGVVYALDLHPLAIESVRDLAQKRGLENVQTILSSYQTGLPEGSVDVVLLYDIFHMLSEPDAVLGELHRVLTPGGTLSVQDPHISRDQVMTGITRGGLFTLVGEGQRTCTFET